MRPYRAKTPFAAEVNRRRSRSAAVAQRLRRSFLFVARRRVRSPDDSVISNDFCTTSQSCIAAGHREDSESERFPDEHEHFLPEISPVKFVASRQKMDRDYSDERVGNWRRLKALVWKSWLAQRRRYVWSLAEILLPLTLVCTLMIVHFLVAKIRWPDTYYKEWTVNGDARDFVEAMVDGYPVMHPNFRPSELHYAPKTQVAEIVMRKLVDKLNLVPTWAPGNPCSQYIALLASKAGNDWQAAMRESVQFSAIAHENGTILERRLFNKLKDSYLPSFYAGIIFDGDFAYGRNTTNVEYTLRFPFEQRNLAPDAGQNSLVYTWSTNHLGIDSYSNVHRWPNSSDANLPGYWREGFLTLQHALDVVLTESIQPTSLCMMAMVKYQMKRFPFPAYVSHPLIEQFPLVMPSILVVSFVVSILYITRSVTIEKERNLVEYIHIVTGLPNWVQWMSHFFINFIKLFIVSVAMTAMLCTTFLSTSNPLLIGIFLFSFSLNVIAYAFLVGAFFKKANNATLCAGIVWFLCYVPCLYAQRYYTELSRSQKLAFSLLAHGATVIGCQLIATLEAQGSGLSFENAMARSPDYDNGVAPVEIWLLLFFDALPLFFIAFYVDAVKFGRRPWYFFVPCLSCFFDRSSKKSDSNAGAPSGYDATSVERTVSDKRASVVVENAVMKYSDRNRTEIRALNHLSMFIQPGELTVILGHNGAGKTTLMRVITGCSSLNGGAVYIHDRDVSTDLDDVRHMLGYCPQYNTLFDYLTVEEHLKFYLQLKNADSEKGNDKIARLLIKLRLDKKRTHMAAHLSGGQKRRLSLAIALVGGAKVILLDEPTSGMDPGAKGDIIDILKYEKQPHVTFVLVTHYVDEAEVLGDRIAILADGRLRCYGTNMFLKNRFGNGYRLTVRFRTRSTRRFRIEKAAQRVQEAMDEMCVGAARLLRFKGEEATFLLQGLPDRTETCRRHQLVLLTLETLTEPLQIRSLSVNMPSMQDVFMNCSSNEFRERLDKRLDSGDSNFAAGEGETDMDTTRREPLILNTAKRNTGIKLLIQQFRACLFKRIAYGWRQKKLLFFQFLVLILSVGAGALINELLRRNTPVMPPFPLDVRAYGKDLVVPFVRPPSAANSTPSTTKGDTTPPPAVVLIDQLMEVFRQSIFDVSSDNKSHVEEPNVDSNFSNWLLEKSRQENGGDSFTRTRLFGVEIGETTEENAGSKQVVATGYFNARAMHSLGALMNALGNAVLLRYCPNCRIKAVNHPLPQTTVLFYPFGDDFVTVLCLAVGMSFFVTAFAVCIVEERANGAKHLQLSCGLRLSAYWIANCFWDGFIYALACVVVLFIWWLGGSLLLVDAYAFVHMIMLMAAFGAAILPFTYAVTFLLRTPASAVTILTSVNLLLGLTPTVVVATLAQMSFTQEELRDVETRVSEVFTSVFPQFTLARALMAYYNNKIMRQQCEAMKLCDWLSHSTNPYFKVTSNALEWQVPGVGRLLLCLCVQSVVLFCFLFLIEWFSLRPSQWWRLNGTESNSIFSKRHSNAVSKIETSSNDSVILDVRQLTVRYNNASAKKDHPPAVDGLSFVVSRGEIFGFNGENGSGKTSTYKVLSGSLSPYGGTAFIKGNDVRRSWRKTTEIVGYCPQFDALLERLTGCEVLTHFARLRGLSDIEIPTIVDSLLTTFDLQRQADRYVHAYSGGNKRKISLAIALLGSPPLLLLDEPTCGVDPKARRTIWNVLKFMKHQWNAAIVLTSHDMEECEALCDRMGVLVRGRLVCVDTPASLAEQYGGHYILRLTVENDHHLDDVEEAVFTYLPDAQLKAKPNACQVHFAIPKSSDVTWSRLYRIVEELLIRWPLSDFAVSYATLQEAFVAISRGESGVTHRRPNEPGTNHV